MKRLYTIARNTLKTMVQHDNRSKVHMRPGALLLSPRRVLLNTKKSARYHYNTVKFSSKHLQQTSHTSPLGSRYIIRADSRFAPSQWETALQSNAVSHWLGANLESALHYSCVNSNSGVCPSIFDSSVILNISFYIGLCFVYLDDRCEVGSRFDSLIYGANFMPVSHDETTGMCRFGYIV